MQLSSFRNVGLAQNGLIYNPAPGSIFQPAPNAVCVGAAFPNLPCSGANDPKRRYYNPRFGWTQDINYFSSQANTHFNALQATLEKHFGNGYQFVLNYAYQKATNYSNTDLEQFKVLTYGNQDDLRQQQLTFFGNLELPFGKGKAFASNANGIVDRIINGFEISPTFNIASGLPFWATYANSGVNKDVGPSEPNYTGSGFNTGLTGNDYAGTLAFFKPITDITTTGGQIFTNPGFDKFGNLKRNSFFGPHFYNADVAVQKNIPIKEGIVAIFRTDFFNVLNHQAYANPGTNIDVNGGTIGGLAPASNPRQLQFAARLKF